MTSKFDQIARRYRLARDAEAPNTVFWSARAGEYAESRFAVPPPHPCYRKKLSWLRDNCACIDSDTRVTTGACAARIIRGMAVKPEYTHAGRIGRQLAKRYGITGV